MGSNEKEIRIRGKGDILLPHKFVGIAGGAALLQ